jgi:hypothetical protein
LSEVKPKLFVMRKVYILLTFTLFTKIISAQQWVWAKTVNSPSIKKMGTSDLVCDTKGNFYVSAITDTIGTCVIKFDSSGTELWRKTLNGNIGITGIAISNDKLYISGPFKGTKLIGTTTFNSFGGSDIFLSALTANGSFIWSKQMGGPGDDIVNSICSDKDGAVYLTGSYFKTATFGTNTISCTNYNSAFVVKYDSSSTLVFLKTAATTNTNSFSKGIKIKVDVNKNLYVIGSFDSGLLLDTCNVGTCSCPYDSDFLCSMDASGNIQWIRTLTGFTDRFNDLSFDQNNDILLSGSQGWTNGGQSIYRKYTKAGQLSWNKLINQYCYGDGYYGENASAEGNNGYLIGTASLHYCPEWTFYSHFYLAQYNSNGTMQYIDSTQFTANLYDNKIETDANGDVIVCGTLSGGGGMRLGYDTIYSNNYQIFIAKHRDKGIPLKVKPESNTIYALNIYPNPSTGSITIDSGNISNKTRINVYDCLGNCILNKTGLNSGRSSIDLSARSKGLYLIEIVNEGSKEVKKIVLE